MVTDEEYLTWCKQRALAYVAIRRLDLAVARMNLDVQARPGCAQRDVAALALLGMAAAYLGQEAVCEWLDLFGKPAPRTVLHRELSGGGVAHAQHG